MKRIYKKYRLLIFLCIFCIAANVHVKTYLLDKQLQRIASLQKMTSESRSNSKDAVSITANAKTGVSIHLAKILSDIGTKPYLGQYIDQVAKLIDKNRVSLDKDLVFEAKETDIPVLVKYDSLFTVKGNYENIKQFLADMQNIRALSSVRSATISPLEPGTNKLALHVGISVYFKKG
ncbi:MAG: hypothetical protein HUN04_13985 [Desulfobacter sp.]|nr:MAG: hypothetical protein HUN04_13985 [Desulfobacter sp.]